MYLELIPVLFPDYGHRALEVQVQVCSAPCPPSPSFVIAYLPLFGVLSLTCPRGDRLSPGDKKLWDVPTMALGWATLPE